MTPDPTDVELERFEAWVAKFHREDKLGADILRLIKAFRACRQRAKAKDAVIEGARKELLEIMQWAGGYPSGIFPEPDLEKARLALDAEGITMDALHGSWARQLLKDVGDIARKGLTALDKGTDDAE